MTSHQQRAYDALERAQADLASKRDAYLANPTSDTTKRYEKAVRLLEYAQCRAAAIVKEH